MRVFKNKLFHKWTIEQGLKDSTLIEAVHEIEQGLYEANLGGHVYKKRLPLNGRGKRGGARVIVAFKIREITVFIYGFSKKQKENITNKETEALKALAKTYLANSNKQLDEFIKTGNFIEVIYE